MLDCIEFDSHLRHCDVLADVAFMAMDLERLGNRPAGDRFVASWASALDGSALGGPALGGPALGGSAVHPALLHHYIAERAFVRAKVACLRHGQQSPGSPEATGTATAARDLLTMCAAHLEAAAPRLVVVGGSPGTGKTTVAVGLGQATGWPVLHSDVVRKQRLGLDPASRPSAADYRRLYEPSEVAATYTDVLAAAADHLAMGRSVILDASWTSAAERDRARKVANGARADVIELQCVCDPHQARRRVADRLGAAGPSGAAGASDATAEVADLLASRTDAWPEATQLDTEATPALVVQSAVAEVGPW